MIRHKKGKFKGGQDHPFCLRIAVPVIEEYPATGPQMRSSSGNDG